MRNGKAETLMRIASQPFLWALGCRPTVLNSCVRPASLKPEEENWCSVAIKCKALLTIPLTGTAQFNLAYGDGKHKIENKISSDFEDPSLSPSSFVKWDNTPFPT